MAGVYEDNDIEHFLWTRFDVSLKEIQKKSDNAQTSGGDDDDAQYARIMHEARHQFKQLKNFECKDENCDDTSLRTDPDAESISNVN